MSLIHEINEKIELRERRLKELQEELMDLKKQNKKEVIPSLLAPGVLAGSVWSLHRNSNPRDTSYLRIENNGSSRIGEFDKACQRIYWGVKQKISDAIEEVRHTVYTKGIEINFKWNNVAQVADFVRKHGLIVDFSDTGEKLNKLQNEVKEYETLFKL